MTKIGTAQFFSFFQRISFKRKSKMFKINDAVRVKPGIKDVDNETFDLSGWQGKITNIEQMADGKTLVLIAWDSLTIQTMPKAFIEESVAEGCDFTEMNLFGEEVELATARKDGPDRAQLITSLKHDTRWADLGEQGKRIKAVEDDCEHDYDLMDHWFVHLENNLELPIKARYVGDSNQKIKAGSEISINGFADANDDYGVIGSAIYQKKWIKVPLCDLEVLESSEKTEALEDYIVWFANR